MSASVTLVFDNSSAPDAVGAAIRKLLSANGAVCVASPYVSGNPQHLLALPESRWSDLTLVCDLDSGNCDPRVLKGLLDKGASVRTLKGLHAKAYISKRGAALGSANSTSNGLGPGMLEASVVLKGSSEKRRAVEWFEGLKQVSTDVSQRVYDPTEFAKLLAIWQSHQRDHDHPNGAQPKPSLLAAILRGLPALHDVAFSWYTNEAELRKSVVKNTALQHGIAIPSKSKDWTWFESPFEPGLLERLNKTCLGKPQVGWEVKMDDDGQIVKFKAQDSFASPFLGGFRLKRTLVSIIRNCPAPTPFNLRADRLRLAQILTRGLSRADAKLKRAIDNNLSILSVTQLTRLTELGMPP
jgi:hypothetical protein